MEALAIADEQGLEALTMAAMAERLGVTPMAIYRHIARIADMFGDAIQVSGNPEDT
jgi:AcrR family transcriptional regulator